MKMASMSTCFTLTMTPKSRLLPFTSKSSFNRKPPDSYSFPPFQTLRISWKLQNSRVLVPVVRATSDVDVISSAVRPGSVVETDKLPSDVRNRAMDAVDSSGGRVTVGDVASKAGLTLAQAQKALQALAADTDGFLEVSDEGDVLYVLPKDYRAKLAAKSLRIKVEPLVDKAKAGAEYLIRVSFGTALIASIVLVFTAIIVALSSTKSNDDNRGRRSKSYDTGLTFYFSPTNLSGYWDPYYHRRQQAETDDENGMNFIESIFSFVFGDGDPNQGIEEKRWKLIGQYIASHGGVVAAEELAPYLDLQSTGGTMSDESYILPVLLRFDGQPELDEEGNILYRFPSLQRTASSKRSGRKEYVGRFTDWVGQVEKVFLEKKWQFSKTNVSERAMVIGLGGLNLFGVIVLGAMLKEPAVTSSGFIKFIANIFPLLQIYAGSFFAIPLIRWLLYSKRNLDIEKRNHAREQYVKALGSPDISLRLKLLHAREMAQRTVIGRDRIVYTTDRDFIEQDYEAKEWDRKFQKTERAD